MATTMEVEILEDGTISVTTGDIEDTKHISADNLLDEIAELAGGQRDRKRREHEFWQNKAVRRGGRVIKTNR